MAKTESNTAYRHFAIMTVLFTYFNMKDFGERMCESLSDKKREVKVSEAREQSVVLKRDRNASITEDDIVDAVIDSVRNLISNDSRLESQISEVYEFEYDKKYIDKQFVKDNFDIRILGKTVVIDIER